MRNGEYQKLLGSRAGSQRGWGGAGPRITGPGVAVLLRPLSSSAGSQGEAGSDGLIVAHVPDLSSLGLLMQQRKTGQVF